MLRLTYNKFRVLALAAALLAATAFPAHAVTYNLVTGAVGMVMPDSTVALMWGYGLDGGAVTVPGPALDVPAGENLTINLTNNLPVPVSIVIPGLGLGSPPLPVTEGGKVRSFTTEAAALGGTASYTFTTRPGTYLYESGTDPGAQVPMGLYGAVRVAPASGGDTDVTVLFSEVDPAQNAAVVSAALSTGYPPATSDYKPTYFLINGIPYDPGNPAASVLYGGTNADTALLRFINAGSYTRMPSVQGAYLTELTEDGYAKNHAQDRLSVFLAAGATKDVLVGPLADGDHPLYDRRYYVSNNGSYPGGMLAMLNIGASPPPAPAAGPNLLSGNNALNLLSMQASGTPGVVLVAPAEASVILKDSVPTFSWAANLTGNFVLEFSKTADFSKKVKSFTLADVSATQFTPDFSTWKKIRGMSKKGRPAYWRVVGTADGGTYYSETGNFVVVKPPKH